MDNRRQMGALMMDKMRRLKAPMPPNPMPVSTPVPVSGTGVSNGLRLIGAPRMKTGGLVKSPASSRADGCAQRGKTKGRFV